jgi:hypothetical protein
LEWGDAGLQNGASRIPQCKLAAEIWYPKSEVEKRRRREMSGPPIDYSIVIMYNENGDRNGGVRQLYSVACLAPDL